MLVYRPRQSRSAVNKTRRTRKSRAPIPRRIAPSSENPWTWTVLAGVAAVAVVRLWECASLPVETGDVVRNLIYGVAVGKLGLSAAGQPLAALAPEWQRVAWARLPYNYPPVALAFFTIVSALSPTAFFAKLSLTALEATNAWLISRVCGSRLLGLVYWASPASIWWVSREGQFEPLQTSFALVAVLVRERAPLASGVALGLAIWTKMTAAALLPWLAWKLWTQNPRALALGALGLALGSLPALAAEASYGGISNVLRYSSPLTYNPYYWNWTATSLFSWNSGWLIGCDELASYGLLVALGVLALRSREPLAFLAPFVFTVFCKVHTNVQFWYWLALPALLVPIPEARWRFALIAACPLLDVRSALEVALGSLGRLEYRGLQSPFAAYRWPR